ncbi:trafficking protein particle complex 8 [Chrysochromulina tobinii]|uniref:Trafficking protein particle complex 8 n=1 Tax=Chrysochromulina tobinii TaxID=1460289 RepID=A0A0M0JGH7_9EUKA|nr:trafficking protein particle complex 8 [Chrysochromulina tobinii]|eukprot:KOO25348.1 trafficking protein particle complex 8 [Chrysochromulina sp. CCMP291]
MVEVFPPPELIEALEPPECRAAFARRAITHTNEYYAAFSHNLMQTVDKLVKEHRQQHGNPPKGQDTPDRLILTQRRQLLLARSQSANRSKGSSATAAVAVVESAVTSPVSLVDAERLEEAIDDVGDDPKLDPRVVAAAKRKLERARAQSKCTITEKLAAARAGKACEFQFMRAKVLLERDYKSAPMHKSVEDDSELYTMLYLSSAECCQHMFRDKVLAVSHRWDRPEEPDPTGAQMKAIKRMLRANPQYEYMWLDYSCAPQGERTPQQQELFSLTLENMDFLFLGASVLILLDMSYMSRFWTQFEAWMAFQEVDSHGVLRCAQVANRRCTIECIHNANEYTKLGLIDMWSNKTPEEAYNILKSEDVSVTNKKDKELQLPIIQTFKESVQKTWRAAVESGEMEAVLSPSRRPSFKADTETALGEPASPSVKGVLARPQLAPSSSVSTVRFEADSSTGQGAMLMKAFDTIEQLSQQLAQANAEVLQANKEVLRLSQAHTDATSRAHTEFANAVSKQAELHVQLLAEQSRERKKDGHGPGR